MELLVAKELQEGMPGGFSSGSKWEKGRGSEEIGAALVGANDSAGRNERKERKAARGRRLVRSRDETQLKTLWDWFLRNTNIVRVRGGNKRNDGDEDEVLQS